VVETTGYLYLAPDLAIEIISPTEKPGPIRRKLAEYLKHGVKEVWHVFPETQEIVVYQPDGTSKSYRPPEVIENSDILPGFRLNVGMLFAE
jgi:Uma2 family endonuclease